MKKSLLVSLFALIAIGAWSQSNEQTPYVEVRGVASRLVEPNRVEIRITLSEADSKGKVKLATLESALATALKAADIDVSKQLVVVSQSSGAQKRNGLYQFKTYALTLTTAEQVASVFDAFAAQGVQNAEVFRTYNVDQKQIESELQVEAMKDSQKTAKHLMSALGQTIGSAIQVQYWSNYAPEAVIGYGVRRSKEDVSLNAVLPDNLSLKPINVQVSVTVRYLLHQGGK